MHATGRVTVTGAVGSFDERDLPGVQATLLLVFLALERAPVARDRVADTLWIGEPPPGWSSGLNALASKIRSLFGSVGVDRGVLVGSGGTIGLDLPSDAWIDLESADWHLDRASGSRRRGDLAGAVADATVATAVLRRPFLPGIDNPWCDRVRRRNGTLLFKAYEMLAEAWK
jgi:DNA-binding SARP family transcriptional activator